MMLHEEMRDDFLARDRRLRVRSSAGYLHLVDDNGINGMSLVVNADGSFGRIAFEGSPYAEAIKAYVVEAWPRYLAEKAKRSVVVSRETMRSTLTLPFDGTRVLLLDGRTDEVVVGFFDAAGWSKDEVEPHGWWPIPDLTPMPTEFDGWLA